MRKHHGLDTIDASSISESKCYLVNVALKELKTAFPEKAAFLEVGEDLKGC